MFDTLQCATVAAGIVVLYVVSRFIAVRSRPPLPPGPKGLPLLGNIKDLPEQYHWLTFSKWKEQYGDLVSVTLLGKSLIILNSAKVAIDIMEKKHQLYSERPRLVMAGELTGWNAVTVLLPYGDLWREHRRMLGRLFGTHSAMQKFYDIEIQETRKLLRKILRDSDNLGEHVRYLSGSLILKIVYGYDVKESNDSLVELVERAMTNWALMVRPGQFLVDFLPALKHVPAWVPGASFQKTAATFKKTLHDVINVPYNMVKEQLLDWHTEIGTAVASYTANLLTSEDLDEKTEDMIKSSATAIYAGGADSSVAQIHGFFLLMLLYPEVQRKAQAELDLVVGNERFPNYGDRERLPYLEALMKEVMRFHSIIPLGGGRTAIKDDIHDGYFIPKGSILQPNLWQMLHDPDVYHKPLEFDPERFLAASPPHILAIFALVSEGGILPADAEIWISFAIVLSVFNITPKEGSPPIQSHAQEDLFTGEPISHPKPFKCDIEPRSAKAEALILTIDSE